MKARRSTIWTLGMLVATFGLSGCSADKPLNPSFALRYDDAKAALRDMAEHRGKLARPVVVLGGWIDPGVATAVVGGQVRDVVDDGRVLDVSFAFCGSFDDCRQRLIERVEAAFPSTDPVWTQEVDVIAVSMGGLVARYAAAPPPQEVVPPPPEGSPTPEVEDHTNQPSPRRLKIARLFTISSPHRGAQMAPLPTFDRLQIDMRPGSDFMQRLEAELPEVRYDIYPYVRLGDLTVGEANAAPPGRTAWWLATPFLQGAHLSAFRDPRILADICRRLRNEPAYATAPAAPLPDADAAE
jgi:pimeloyl-ACP methyl ester carboxylesterase